MLQTLPTIFTSWDIPKRSKNGQNSTHVLWDTECLSISWKIERHKVMCSMKEIWPYIRNTLWKQFWFKTKHFWVLRQNLPKKEVSETECKKKKMLNSKLKPWNTLGYWVSFETKHFEVLGQIFPKISSLGMEFEKKIVKFRKSFLEYTYVASFI